MIAPPFSLAGLRAASARLSYGGPGRLDTTFRSKSPLGQSFAPSAGLLFPFVRERQTIDQLRKANVRILDEGLFAQAMAATVELDKQERALWESYRPAYLAEQRIHAGLLDVRRLEKLSLVEQMAWRRGARPRVEDWLSLFEVAAEGRIVFCCFCAAPHRAHCHTRLLCEMVAEFGGEDLGELPEAEQLPVKPIDPARRGRRRATPAV